MILSRDRYPATTPPMTHIEIQRLLEAVDEGFMSMRKASKMLGWDMDQMQMEIWGEVRL
jgi:hypothetical protein